MISYKTHRPREYVVGINFEKLIDGTCIKYLQLRPPIQRFREEAFKSQKLRSLSSRVRDESFMDFEAAHEFTEEIDNLQNTMVSNVVNRTQFNNTTLYTMLDSKHPINNNASLILNPHYGDYATATEEREHTDDLKKEPVKIKTQSLGSIDDSVEASIERRDRERQRTIKLQNKENPTLN